MTNSSDRGNGNGSGGIMHNPALDKLKEAAGAYAAAQGVKLASRAGNRMSGLTDKLEDVSENGGSLGSIGQVAKGVVGGGSNGQGVVKSAASKVTDKVKSAVGGGGGKKSGQAKAMNIIEQIDVGVPIAVAYDQWTQFADFSRFMKAIQSVDQKDETTTSWKAKIALSTRTWEGRVIEQIPEQRIVWTSEGPKGTNKGVVTFHSLGPELTRILLDIEYYPSGVVEKTANLWRPVGRRTRLELKNYRRFIMMEGEATGSWRGRIEDGEVVAEDEQSEGQEPGQDEMSEQDSDQDSDQGSDQDSDRAEDSEQEEEPEEEPQPQRARRRARDEQPEDEPEEEPEEEPAPRRARSRRSEPDSDEVAAPRRARRARVSAASRSR